MLCDKNGQLKRQLCTEFWYGLMTHESRAKLAAIGFATHVMNEYVISWQRKLTEMIAHFIRVLQRCSLLWTQSGPEQPIVTS